MVNAEDKRMKNITKDKQQRTKYLVEQGTTEKEINRILKEEYGAGINKNYITKCRKEYKKKIYVKNDECNILVIQNQKLPEDVEEAADYLVALMQDHGITKMVLNDDGFVEATMRQNVTYNANKRK